jgi:hypothetical protein
MKHSETENLLSLIFQSGGTVQVSNGQLLVGPVALAQRFGDQIRRLKPEILLALGHCPICASKLIVKMENRQQLSDEKSQRGVVTYCPMKGHYNKWQVTGEGK